MASFQPITLSWYPLRLFEIIQIHPLFVVVEYSTTSPNFYKNYFLYFFNHPFPITNSKASDEGEDKSKKGLQGQRGMGNPAGASAINQAAQRRYRSHTKRPG
jgi:hypothetical protein